MAKLPDDDSFLSRWSRRKAEARVEDPQTPPAELSPPPPADPEPPQISDEDLTALPKIEDLVSGDDIRAFLRPGVPSALKDAALRKMWLLTPAIRDYRDPAVDYAWDWNTPGGVPGDGVAPSAERAAQMMRELFAPRPPKDPAPQEPVSEGQTAASAGAEVAQDEQSAPETDARIDEAAYDKSISNQSDTEGAIPRRRHGGALPT